MAAPPERSERLVSVVAADDGTVTMLVGGGESPMALSLTGLEAAALHADLGAILGKALLESTLPGSVHGPSRALSARAVKRPRPGPASNVPRPIGVAAWPPRLAIVVPFREQAEQRRGEHLKEFLGAMPKWLQMPPGAARVFVAVQPDDGHKFNRGLLLNMGARAAMRAGFPMLVLHDVDLIPSAELRPWYARDEIPRTALHLGARWDRYNYPGYLGGVLKVASKDYVAANGFPNSFWGWGGEDDAFAARLRAAGVTVVQPTEGSYRDLEFGASPDKRASTRVKDGGRAEWRNMMRREDLARDRGVWRSDGLSSISHDTKTTRLECTADCITIQVPTSSFVSRYMAGNSAVSDATLLPPSPLPM